MLEALTPTDVRELLDRYGLAPRRSEGQNFLVDGNWARKIIREAGVGPDDTVLEIGPGLGSLTLGLSAVATKVVAVEIDAGLVRALREVVADRPNVEVVHADALAVDLGALLGGPARMVSNLPYSAATALVLRCVDTPQVTDLFVTVQREVGERWAASAGDDRYGGVSVRLALEATVEVVAEVPRTVFYPVPAVDSVTARIRRRPDAPAPEEQRRVAEVVGAAFATRRKTLRNALRSLAPVVVVEEALAAAGIDRRCRAEELTLADFRRLAAALEATGEVYQGREPGAH